MGRDEEATPPASPDDSPKAEKGHVEHPEGGGEGDREDYYYAQLDKRVDHKFDRHIVPWIFGIWLFAFIDRSNIGNAKIDGLTTDLGIATGTGFNVALLVFYVPYILVDVPSNWAVKRARAGVYLPALITAWGLVCTFLGFTRSLAGLVVCRLLLGLFEGGLLGGIVVYLAMFYRRRQMQRRIGYFYSAAPLSGAFGGLLATGLARISYGGYDSWPWIFFIEGIVTVLFGVLCFFAMPHTPADAKFLTEEERARALARMKLDSHGATSTDDVNEERFDWHWVRMAFRAPQTWFCSLIWFFLLVSLYSFSLFLPTIISGLGYQATTAQLFTVPPYIAGFVLVLAMSFLSDHIRVRGPLMAVNCSVAIAGYVMLRGHRRLRHAPGLGREPGAGWLSNNLAPHYVRATGIGFLIAFANCAAFIATFIYLSRDAPGYTLGHSVSLGSLVLCLATVCLQMAYLRRENRRRGRGDRDDRLGAGKEEHRLGHRHPAFEYIL
ncbi:MFS transporter-like protein [Xylariomycetidae sp. FL2044]|nr:MFS transporter-like protein [Xylariomycetidae sp. FL2044]